MASKAMAVSSTAPPSAAIVAVASAAASVVAAAASVAAAVAKSRGRPEVYSLLPKWARGRGSRATRTEKECVSVPTSNHACI